MNSQSFSTSCICLLAFLLIAVGYAQNEAYTLQNDYLRVEGEGATLTSLRVDAQGKKDYDSNWLLGLGYRGVEATADSEVTANDTTAKIAGVVAREDTTIEVDSGGVADKLEPGHTLGQSFEVRNWSFDSAEALLPTWGTTTSGGLLRLRRGGPEGDVIAERRIENAADNAWQKLEFPRQPPGTYYIELSDVTGDYGWWSGRESTYEGGEAYVDGKPAPDVERAFKVHGRSVVAHGSVTYQLDGARLHVSCHLAPLPDTNPTNPPVDVRLRWDNTGYDVSADSVPFKRFFTDNFRYMPTHQLKRWKARGGRYERAFAAQNWIEADGTGDHDLRFNGSGPHLVWLLGADEATLQINVADAEEGPAVSKTLTIEALERADQLPDNWPRFRMPDAQQAEQANIFYYERGFTYPAVWGPAAWFAWMTTAHDWHTGPHARAHGDYLRIYNMSEEGYVHTWGGGAGWPFPDNEKYDTRHFDTNARFILACWRYAAWTGDAEFLRDQAGRIRRAMDYQLETLGGRDGLIITDSDDVNGRHMGVGNNYWDILPFGHLDAFANAVWYASLEAMAQIEEMLGEAGGADTDAPARSAEFYRALARKAREEYNDTFWDDEKGRYIGCIDVDGTPHDYGFTFVNMEAMAYGLADAAQARRIYDWMENEPTSTGKADTYSRWIFAPRANTIHNPRWNPEEGKLDDVPQDPWWHFGWRGTKYGDQCQDGGAILYTSFYDLMARAKLIDPDNAWQRWERILQRWRMPDHLCGGSPLYRGEHPQQIGAGAVGLDIPFPESSLVPCWLLYGLMGIEATAQGLVIAPNLPSQMPWLQVDNLVYHGERLSVRVTNEEVTISSGRPGEQFNWRRPVGPEGRVVFRSGGQDE